MSRALPFGALLLATLSLSCHHSNVRDAGLPAPIGVLTLGMTPLQLLGVTEARQVSAPGAARDIRMGVIDLDGCPIAFRAFFVAGHLARYDLVPTRHRIPVGRAVDRSNACGARIAGAARLHFGAGAKHANTEEWTGPGWRARLFEGPDALAQLGAAKRVASRMLLLLRVELMGSP